MRQALCVRELLSATVGQAISLFNDTTTRYMIFVVHTYSISSDWQSELPRDGWKQKFIQVHSPVPGQFYFSILMSHSISCCLKFFSLRVSNCMCPFAVLAAEIVKHFCPRLVELHNYSSAHARAKKVENWDLLNRYQIQFAAFYPHFTWYTIFLSLIRPCFR